MRQRPLARPARDHRGARRGWPAALLLVFAAAAVAVAPACGSDDVGPHSRLVGGRCTVDNDCSKRCITGGSFPEGYCSVTCLNDNDCPGGSVCISQNGGICMATCSGAPADCDPYGAGFSCSRETRQGGSGGALVCIGGG